MYFQAPSAGLVYADLGTAVPKKKKGQDPPPQFKHVPEDKVVYAAIDAKATAAMTQQENGNREYTVVSHVGYIVYCLILGGPISISGLPLPSHTILRQCRI